MAIGIYRFGAFYGIDQSSHEGAIGAGFSPDACNMETDDGSLRVCNGFVRHFNAPVPGEKPIRRLFVWQSLVSRRFIIIAGNDVYAYTETDETPCWKLLMSYPETVKGLRWDCCICQINGVEHFILACGEHCLAKWDGVGEMMQFGSDETQAAHKVNFLCMHYGRLFAAGDPEHPIRLYWSQAPGDNRNIENWSADDASPNTGGGHVEIGDTAGDPITGLIALSNQLLIFKRRSIYRLLGDRPSNYSVYRVHAEVEQMNSSACVLYGDAPFWMTGGGLYFFDGQNAQKSRHARRISRVLEGARFGNCRAAKRGTKLYFSAYEESRDEQKSGLLRIYDNALIVYDTERQTYMLRRGFNVSDLCSHDGVLYMVNENRLIYRFDEGEDYDGQPIEAYWHTPLTDLNSKPAIKGLRELFLQGVGYSENAVLLLNYRIDASRHYERFLMPRDEAEVMEIPLKNEGRNFAFCFLNEAGSRWRILGGVELLTEQRLR